MKIRDIAGGIAECIWFDAKGEIFTQDFELDRVSPFWLSIGPRTLWPEVTDIEEEYQPAASSRSKKRQTGRVKAVRKGKRSRKIKRGIATAHSGQLPRTDAPN